MISADFKGSDAGRAVFSWLITVALMVALMMLIGAITRLTESGLSMVEWRPLIGALPPLSEAEWYRVFDLYRQTSEYRLENAGMTLPEFKTIFWWEYIHR
ncbi:MAG: COX15/CtaA family protein, partial [Pseudomonadota bacterium]|nr:COX15/CtaA family protein [Pseudomonadota bacterium]